HRDLAPLSHRPWRQGSRALVDPREQPGDAPHHRDDRRQALQDLPHLRKDALAMWQAIILAAGRGPDDPMAKAYGVANKTVIPVAGVPMLARVAGALRQSGT